MNSVRNNRIGGSRNPIDVTRFATLQQTQANPATTSEKYAFIPTNTVLEILGSHGWNPMSVQEKNAREENRGYQKHIVRLQNPSFASEINRVGDTIPEILVMNSHGGTSAFSLMAGLFELVCTNGLIVSTGLAEKWKVRHSGFAEAKVSEAIARITEFFPKVFSRTDELKQIEVSRPKQLVYAKAASTLINEVEKDGSEKFHIEPDRLLVNHRPNQNPAYNPTLWNTFNTVQENIMRGQVYRRNRQTGRPARSSAVRGVDKDVKLNTALWTLTEEYAKLLGA